MTQNHADLQYAKMWVTRSQVYDAVSPFGFNQIMSHASRHCVANTVQPNPGSIATHWETKQEWSDHTWQGYYNMTSFHEFGHTLALAHNFMGSIDQNNFPIKTDPSGNPILDANGNNQYAIYTNSVMEYDVDAADFFADAQWGPYDKGAIAWIYSNNAPKPVAPGRISITGQIDSTTPWNDPMGFQSDGATEIQFLSLPRQRHRLHAAVPAARLGHDAERDHRQPDRHLRLALGVHELPRVPQVLGRLRSTRITRRRSSATCAASSCMWELRLEQRRDHRHAPAHRLHTRPPACRR